VLPSGIGQTVDAVKVGVNYRFGPQAFGAR
jgi:hypothetical protein